MTLSHWKVIPLKEAHQDLGTKTLRAWRNISTGDILAVEEGIGTYKGQYIIYPLTPDHEGGRIIYSSKSYEATVVKATAIMEANDRVVY